MSTLILVRHGRTAYNREGRLQGRSDIPLDEVGRVQAEDLAAAMRALRPERVIASPLQRAWDTARILAEPWGAPVEPEEALIERGFGQWEGLTREEIHGTWPAEHEDWLAGRPVDGLGIESRAAVAERVAAHLAQRLADADGLVVAVAHGAAITLGITALLGLDPEGPRLLAGLDNCACSVLEPLHAPAGAARMRLLSHNGRPDFTRWAPPV